MPSLQIRKLPDDLYQTLTSPMATSNSPTYGHPNSPRQDG